MSLISLENVTKTYFEDTSKFNALNNVSLEIEEGENIAIIGPSGSGKSTLLHILGCLDRPTSGKVIIEEQDTSKMNDNELAKLRNKKIGFVFQFFNLYPTLTVKRNIELPMLIGNKSSEERERKVKELLEMVNLTQRANYMPNQLSGGEKQRIAIARALANNPTIVLADEPTGNLDTKTGKEIIKMLEKLNLEYNITLIIITHDRDIASNAKRIINIKDGEIV
jgi:putative ABC transport system ATP-binding protein